MRLAIAQIDTVPGAFDETVERMVAQAAQAKERQADLVVFPLAALAGVDQLSYADRVPFMTDVAEAVATLAERLAMPALVPVPIDLGEPEGTFDVLLIADGSVQALCLTQRLHDAADAQATSELSEFSFGGRRFALALTYHALDQLDDYDYDVDTVLYLSPYPFALDDPSSALGANLADGRFVDDARGSGAWLVGVGSVGGYGDQVFCGSSFVLDPSGTPVAMLPAFEDALEVVELKSRQERATNPLAPEVFDAPFHLWQAVSLGIRDFVAKQGATDVALALDGSLSGQVLLALASDALGPLRVHALVGAAAGKRAPTCRDLARRLRVDQVDGPGQLAGFDAHDLDALSLAELARAHGALVLGSLDKTALALGQGGAHVQVADLLPLGDIYRSDVLDMAHVRNTISPLFRKLSLGPADVLNVPQGTSAPLVIAGEQALVRVDEILLGYVEYDRPLASLVGEGRGEASFVDAILRAQRASELSRRTLAPVLCMSTHTLDDARFPLGYVWNDHHRSAPSDLWLKGKGPATLWAAPDASDTADSTAEPKKRDGRDDRRPSQEAPDLSATLSLLRDLAEQGGFNLQGLPQEPGGWGSIFSEN